MYKKWSSRAAMVSAGWFLPDPPEISQCRDCGQEVEWVKTRNQKNVPLDRGTCTVHFETCPGSPATANRSQPAEPARQETSANTVGLPAAQQLVAALVDCANAVRELISELRQRRGASAPGARS